MSRADDITFRLGLNSRRFNKGISAAGVALRGFLAGAVAGFSISAIKDIVSGLSEIGKKARRVALTTDALQELRYSAELAGVPVTALDIGMQRFARRISEIGAGKKNDLSKVLEANNVALKDGDGRLRSQIDILGDYAELLKYTTSEADRTRLAFLAFDSEGVSMVNMLKDGRDGLEKTRDEFRRLGGVIDTETIAAAERLDDKFTKILASITTVVKKMVVASAIGIDAAVGVVYDPLPQIEEFKRQLVVAKSLLTQYGDQIDKQVSDRTRAEIKRLEGLIATLSPHVTNHPYNAIKRETVTPPTAEEIAKAKALARANAARAKSIKGVIGALQLEFDNLSRTAVEQKIYNELSRASVDLKSAEGQKIRELIVAIDAENVSKKQGIENLKIMEQQQRDLRDQAGQFFDEGINIGAAFRRGSDEGIQALKDLAAQMLINIIRAQLLKSLFPGSGGSDPWANLRGGSSYPKFAKGGISNGPSIFGDAGPEAAVPLPDGRSIPVTFKDFPASLAGSGGGNMHVTVGISENNGNLRPFVESISQGAAVSAVGAYAKNIAPGQMVKTMQRYSRGGGQL